MKREDYFTIMDCVSEDDAAEMMRYCRSEQFPDREEEIVMTKFTEHAEKESRRGKGIAAAVAAVLVCANVAGGAYLLRGGNQPDTQSETNAGMSMQSELTPAATENTPDYVKLMQKHFTDINGQPCTFDFTGYGKDFDIQWENDDYKLTLRAVTGCEWALYYFYDVEPKKGQTWDQYIQDMPHFRMYITSESENWWGSQDSMGESATDMMGQDKTLDNGVWHFCASHLIQPDVPLYQDDSCMYFSLNAKGSMEDAEVSCAEKTALDFFTYQHPMETLETPVRLADICEGKIMTAAAGERMLTKRAVTPFGVFYCGEPDESADENFMEYAGAQKDGETLADYVPSEQYQRTIDNDMIAEYGKGQEEKTYPFAQPSFVGVYKQTPYMNLLFQSPVPLKNAQKSLPENMQEIKEAPAETPQYVQLMQEYFTKTTGQKCDYDFTGLGQDYNYEYEYPDYTMTLKSVVGCDWVVYYFYDIKPKDTSEPDYFEFQSKIGDNNIIGNVRTIKDTTVNFAFCEERMGFLSEPERILENGVWHCYSMVVNRSDKPFFHGENEGTKLLILDYQNSLEAAKEPPAPVMFDFTTKEFPLHKTDAPELSAYVTDETDEFWQQHAEEQLAAMCRQTDAHPLTNCAETPFGTFYISDTYYDGIEHAVSEGFSADCFAVNGKPVTRYGCVAWDQRSKLVDGSDHGNVYLFIPEVPAANP